MESIFFILMYFCIFYVSFRATSIFLNAGGARKAIAPRHYDDRWSDREYVSMIHRTQNREMNLLGEIRTECECSTHATKPLDAKPLTLSDGPPPRNDSRIKLTVPGGKNRFQCAHCEEVFYTNRVGATVCQRCDRYLGSSGSDLHVKTSTATFTSDGTLIIAKSELDEYKSALQRHQDEVEEQRRKANLQILEKYDMERLERKELEFWQDYHNDRSRK